MISMFMTDNRGKNQNGISLTKILVMILLALLAVVLGTVLGILYRSRNAQAHKEQKTPQITEEARMDTSDAALLKLTADAGNAYIDETLFLGDSNTVRFMTFEDEDGYTFTTADNTIAAVGMSAGGITTLYCEQFTYGTYTMSQAVEILRPRRILMTFGTNDLNPDTKTDDFIGMYEEQIKAVEKSYPYADLIINSIPPCGEMTHYEKVSIDQIRDFNSAILAMCTKNGWKFLNSFEALADEKTGYAKGEYIEYDGIHYNADGLAAMFRYIRTHAYLSEDRRPEKPDQSVFDELIGPIIEMFETDPLTNEAFAPEVLNPAIEQAGENSWQQVPAYSEDSPQEPVYDEPAYEEPQEPADESGTAEEPDGSDGGTELPEVPLEP